MDRLGMAVLIGCLCVAIAGLAQTAQPEEVTNVNKGPIPVIVQSGDFFNFYTNYIPGTKVTVFTVPEGKRLIVTDIAINPTSGAGGKHPDYFRLEGPNNTPRVSFNIDFPTPVNVFYITGIVFQPGEKVVFAIIPMSSGGIFVPQYDVMINGRLVSE